MAKNSLKKYFPLSFRKKPKLKNLIIDCLLYLVAGIIAGAVIGICAKLPIINLVAGLAGALVELYVLAGIVIAILDYNKLLK